MKQFTICMGLSILFYFLSAIIAGDFNVMNWTHEEGKVYFCMFQIIIWIAPMLINYLEGYENFKN